MNLQNVTIRAVSSLLGGVTTIIAIVDHTGPPARTFYFAMQLPPDADAATINNIERRAISQATDQFLLWVQNGKPTS